MATLAWGYTLRQIGGRTEEVSDGGAHSARSDTPVIKASEPGQVEPHAAVWGANDNVACRLLCWRTSPSQDKLSDRQTQGTYQHKAKIMPPENWGDPAADAPEFSG